VSAKGAGRTDRAWRQIRAHVLERDGWRCHICGKQINPALSGRHRWGPSVDHLDNNRHNNQLGNLAACHMSCNVRKENARRARATAGLKTTREW
jgi:5-methylcytosine-specific restriction endonuclease McrA